MEKIILICAIAIFISSCSSSKDSQASLETTTVKNESLSMDDDKKLESDKLKNGEKKSITLMGKVVDGPIKGATVFIDSNNNCILDEGENSVITSDDGSYKITDIQSSDFYLVSTGGINTSTGNNFEGVLSRYVDLESKNPITNLTPITTLVAEYKKFKSDKTIDQIKSKVAETLKINKDDIDKNPMENTQVFIQSNLVNQSVEIIRRQLSDTYDKKDKKYNTYKDIMSKFAMSIDSNTKKSSFAELSADVIKLLDDSKTNGMESNIQAYLETVGSLNIENTDKIKDYEILSNKGFKLVSEKLNTKKDIKPTLSYLSSIEKKAPALSVKVFDYYYFNGNKNEAISLEATNKDFEAFTFKHTIEGLSLTADGTLHLSAFPSGKYSHDYNAIVSIDNGVKKSDNTILVKANKLDYKFTVDGIAAEVVFVDANNNGIRDEGDTVLTATDGVYLFDNDMRGKTFHVIVENGMSLYNSNLTGHLKLSVDGDKTLTVNRITPMTTLLNYFLAQSETDINTSLTTLTSRLGITSEQVSAESTSNGDLFVKTHQILHMADLITRVLAPEDNETKQSAFDLIMQKLALSIKSASDDTALSLHYLINDVLDSLHGEILSGASIDVSTNKASILSYLNVIESINTSGITAEKYTTYLNILDANITDIISIINDNTAVVDKLVSLSKRDLVAPDITMPDNLDYYFYTDRDKEYIVLQATDSDQANVNFTISGDHVEDSFEAITVDNKVRLKADLTSGRDYQVKLTASDGFNTSEKTMSINVWSWKGVEESTQLDGVTMITNGVILNKISDTFKDTISCSYYKRINNLLYCYYKADADLAVKVYDLQLEQQVTLSNLEEKTDTGGATYRFTGVLPSSHFRRDYVINNTFYFLFSASYWSHPATHVFTSSDFMSFTVASALNFNKPSIDTMVDVGMLASTPGLWRDYQISPVFNGRIYASDSKHLFSIDGSSNKPLAWSREPDMVTECTNLRFPTMAVFNNRLFIIAGAWNSAGWKILQDCAGRYFSAVIDTDVQIKTPEVVVAGAVVTDKGTASIEGGKLKYTPGTDFDSMNVSTSESVILRYKVEDSETNEFIKSAEITITKDADGAIQLSANSQFTIDGANLLLTPIPHLKWSEHRLLGGKQLVNTNAFHNVRPDDKFIFQSEGGINYSFE